MGNCLKLIYLLIIFQYCTGPIYGFDSKDIVRKQSLRNSKRIQRDTANNNNRACMTSSGQPGHCRPTVYCRIPELRNDIWKVIAQLCLINESIGICCPGTFQSAGVVPQVITNINEGNKNGETRIVNTQHERGCGSTTKQFPRITGGRPAEPDEWPWMVAILRQRFPHVHCGGVLITNNQVLTAAHCLEKLKKEDIFVRLGEYDFQVFNETRSRDFRVNNIVTHIDFDPHNFANDIAILWLERPTLFNTYIWPICLPPTGQNWEGWNAIVTGWGTRFFGGPHSKVLMEVTVPIWRQSECQKKFVEPIEDSVLCAGAVEGGRDSCQGDSGGPLLVQLPNRRWIVVGVVSWGIRCGEKNRPGLYTKVDRYLAWIIENSIL